MTDVEKLARLKTLLSSSSGDEIPTDDVLTEYLSISASEILNWLYFRTSVPEDVTKVPAEYENVQIMAVISAVNIIGAEGESLHIENGTHRQFKYDDLIAYIRSHVHPYMVI